VDTVQRAALIRDLATERMRDLLKQPSVRLPVPHESAALSDLYEREAAWHVDRVLAALEDGRAER
jgi:hypothetical protein